MEPTVTQNSALYLAHNILSTERAALFRRMRLKLKKQSPDLRRAILNSVPLVPQFQRDNGR
jgi:hypothetical protein